MDAPPPPPPLPLPPPPPPSRQGPAGPQLANGLALVPGEAEPQQRPYVPAPEQTAATPPTRAELFGLRGAVADKSVPPGPAPAAGAAKSARKESLSTPDSNDGDDDEEEVAVPEAAKPGPAATEREREVAAAMDDLLTTRRPVRVLEIITKHGDDVYGPVFAQAMRAIERMCKRKSGREACTKWLPLEGEQYPSRLPKRLVQVLDKLARGAGPKGANVAAPCIAIFGALRRIAGCDAGRAQIFHIKRPPLHEILPRLLQRIGGSKEAVRGALRLVKSLVPPPPPVRDYGPQPDRVPWQMWS